MSFFQRVKERARFPIMVKTSLLQNLAVHSPLLLMALISLFTAFVAPGTGLGGGWNSTEDVLSFFTSPYFLVCVLATAVLYMWEKTLVDPLVGVEKFVALWHLTNATWWSFGCDVLSGYFHVMPVLSQQYEFSNPNHLHESMRYTLDAVYLTEMFIHVPLAYLCFYAHAKRWRGRHLIEAFLCGIQIEGTFLFYLPDILEGCSNYPSGSLAVWIFWLFGLFWIFVPIALLLRALDIMYTKVDVKTE